MNNNDNRNKKDRHLLIMSIVVTVITVFSLAFSFSMCTYVGSRNVDTNAKLVGISKIKFLSPKALFNKLKKSFSKTKSRISSKKLINLEKDSGSNSKTTTKKVSKTVLNSDVVFKCKDTKVENVQSCVDGFILPKLSDDLPYSQMQNFAFSSEYVYFSSVMHGERGSNFRERATSHIVRAKRSSLKDFKIYEFKSSGHANSFDVRTEVSNSGKKSDRIFFNNAAYKYSSGAVFNRAIAAFKLSGNERVNKIIPGATFFINNNNKTIYKLASSSEKTYYDTLDKYANNGSYCGGELAVNGDYAALRNEGLIRIFNLKKLLNRKYDLKWSYYVKPTEYGKNYGGLQGTALTPNGTGKNLEALILSQDPANKKNIYIRRYNKKNEYHQGVAKINLSNYYNGNFEPEGIKVYGDYVYIGIVKTSVSPRENDIIRIKYKDLDWKSK